VRVAPLGQTARHVRQFVHADETDPGTPFKVRDM
jgi:hypothetical protein